MEFYGIYKCVSYSELVPKILSQPYYKKLVREERIRVIVRGCKNRQALVEYQSLPEKIKKEYDRINPNPMEDIKKQLMTDKVKVDSEAIEFFRRYELSNGSGLTDVVQKEYILNAQVLNALIIVEKETKLMHTKNGFSHSKLVWDIVVENCESLREIYHHTLPANKARLREKFLAYKKQGYEVLISKKNGNKNTRKIGPAEARILLRLKRSKFPIYTDTQIWEEFNRLAIDNGLNPIKSLTTVTKWLNEPSVMVLWYGAVYGDSKWKSKYCSLIKTDLPTMRDSLWYSDGTKLNLYYRNADGKMCTTSVYEVMDAYSEVFLGYDIAPYETFDSQYRAFRMAVEFAKVRPYEIVNDNQGGHKKLGAQGFFNRITGLHRPTMPYNGQSKTIESAFGRFQAQILHKIWYFTGQNVTAKKLNSKPNIEFIEANAYALPTLEEVKEIYVQCRNEWNNAAHPATGISRIEMYQLSSNPDTAPVSDTDIVSMFWLRSKNPITYTNYGIILEVNKTKYQYDVYGEDGLRDEKWALQNTGRRFRIMYDPMDFSRIELWEDDGKTLRYSTDATPKVTIMRNTQERSEEQSSYMRRTIERNKEAMALTQLELEEFDLDEKIAVELFGLNNPKPKTISRKLMDKISEKKDKGELKAPISLSDKLACDEKDAEEEQVLAYQSEGSYTKTISNVTYDDIEFLKKF